MDPPGSVKIAGRKRVWNAGRFNRVDVHDQVNRPNMGGRVQICHPGIWRGHPRLRLTRR